MVERWYSQVLLEIFVALAVFLVFLIADDGCSTLTGRIK